jgi:hypothetical protein
MVARIGTVLYWLGCVLAVLIIGFGALSVVDSDSLGMHPGVVAAVVGASSVAVWLTGRALRYILAGM